MKKIKTGVVGAAGYTGGELLRLLINHPLVELIFAQSRSQAGKAISDVHQDLLGDSELHFCNETDSDVDVVFLCLAHGESDKFLQTFQFSEDTKIIDLSQDFRDGRNGFVYGLTEWNREEIKNAIKLANPGCFATAIQLALLPLIKNNFTDERVNIVATTGSTGAGQQLTETSHYSWRNDNLSVYKPFTHQHLNEICRSVTKINGASSVTVNFIPQRGPFSRGIFSVLSTKCGNSTEEIRDIFLTSYAGSRFVHLSDKPVDVKSVVNTNKCHISFEKQGDQLVVLSAIDNLLKGAAGQAVQNMNLMFGQKEEEGLKLKASAF